MTAPDFFTASWARTQPAMPQLHYTVPANPACKNCRRTLTATAQPEAGQWIIRCFSSFRRTTKDCLRTQLHFRDCTCVSGRMSNRCFTAVR